MNTRTKAFWKSLSPSTLVNRRVERDLRRTTRGDIEGPAMLLEPKIEPQDDDELPLHRPQLCYRRGPSSQLVEHDGGEDDL